MFVPRCHCKTDTGHQRYYVSLMLTTEGKPLIGAKEEIKGEINGMCCHQNGLTKTMSLHSPTGGQNTSELETESVTIPFGQRAVESCVWE